MTVSASSPPRSLGEPTGGASIAAPPVLNAPGPSSGEVRLDLRLDAEALATCVACGLCLPHCPTYRTSGVEGRSPRGRIALMREAVKTGFITEQFVDHMDSCVQCRGCETACPAEVPFGRLMEETRSVLAEGTGYQPRWRRLGYRLLGAPRTLRALSVFIALVQRVRLLPRSLGLPCLPLRRPSIPRGGDDGERVWLFTGCVMDAWLRPTHVSTARVVAAVGGSVRLPGSGAACCGALHVHAGLREDARRLAERVMTAMEGSEPILVNSAGCGAALGDYGHLLGTPEAAAFSERVVDVHTWLAQRMDRLEALPFSRDGLTAVQDPCHLRHVQRAHMAVREVLAPFVDLVELDDEGLCCGAGGAYSQLRPADAAAVRERKLAAVARSGAQRVVSANPGCAMHLAAAGLEVLHPLDLLAERLQLRD